MSSKSIISEIKRPCVINICSYEGGLLGVSLTKNEGEDTYDYKDVVTEYNFSANEGSIQCAT